MSSIKEVDSGVPKYPLVLEVKPLTYVQRKNNISKTLRIGQDASRIIIDVDRLPDLIRKVFDIWENEYDGDT